MQTAGYVMGDLDGDVDGDLDGDVDGYVMGDGPAVVGRRRRRALYLPPAPGWRHREAAPGVPLPGQGMELLPLTPDLAAGAFSVANLGAIITFSARPQRPFRPERFLVTVKRFPDAVAGIPQQIAESDGIFVGTTLSQLTNGRFDIENFDKTAFGVRMQLVPAAPGIDLKISVALAGPALTGTQSIIVSMLFMGRSIQ